MSSYPKIETLYERDEATYKVKPGVFKNRTYTLIKSWQFTEKIDGTNIRCIWNPLAEERLQLIFDGKSDNSQISSDLIKHLQDIVLTAKLREVFPEVPAVLYGEGYGAGINKGGSYSPTKKFIMFDVLVDGKWWLNWENTCDVASKLGLETVPFVGDLTLEDATAIVRAGLTSGLNPKAKAEGLVGRTAEPLFDKKGARLIVKLKTRDF